MRRRVVITGMGAITPLGNDVNGTMEGQLAGRSGVGPIRHFNASRFPTTFAAQVPDFDLARFIPDARRWAHSGLNSQFAAVAAREALTSAGLVGEGKVDRTRFGVYLGSGEGVQDFHSTVWLTSQTYRADTRDVDSAAFMKGALGFFHAEREAEQELHTTAAQLASHSELGGAYYNCLTVFRGLSHAVR